MRRQKKFDRKEAVERMRNRLGREGWPRVEMSLILGFSAAVGFATSMLLLALGVTSMMVRYPLAVVAAYGAFLLFLRVWIWWRTGARVEVPDIGDVDLPSFDGVSLPSVDLPGGSLSGGGPTSFQFGGGGDFGGGGASSSWGSGGGGGGGGFSLDVDVDDGLAIIAVVIAAALAVCALAACLYVVWAAPVLLAEILVDALLVAGVARGLKNARGQHWLRAALRATWIPALIVFTFLALAGLVLEVAFPEAHSIGAVVEQFSASEEAAP
jgi:hypothetical protein